MATLSVRFFVAPRGVPVDLRPIVHEILVQPEPLTLVDRWWLRKAGIVN